MWWWDDAIARLKRLEGKVNHIMSTLEQLTGLLTEIGAEVDKVSADTDNLLAQLAAIPTPGMTPEQQAAVDAAVASATAIRDRLSALDTKVPDAPSA